MGLWVMPGGWTGTSVPVTSVLDEIPVSEGRQLVVEVLEQIRL